jgi:hypothetical protein
VFQIAIGWLGTFASLSNLSCIGALLSMPRRRDKKLGTCHLANIAKEGGPAITADSTCPLSTLQLVSPDSAALIQ